MSEDHLGLLVATVRRRLKQAVLCCVADRGLAPGQFWVLMALRESPGLSQAELAGRLRIDAPTASRVVSTLTGRKLVRIDLDPHDRRRSALHLTAPGERLAGELAPVAREIRAAVVESLSEPELAALRRGLQQIISNLERFEARASRRHALP